MKFLPTLATLAVVAVTQAYFPSNQTGPTFSIMKSCSTSTPIFEAFYGHPDISPSTFCPQGESDYIFAIEGTSSQPIVQGAKLIISARAGGKLVYSDTQDYCALLNVQSQSCPVPANKRVLLYTRPLRKDMPLV
ncbi:hypothetical protein CPB97_005298, partial [Podila verticillata]